MFDRVVQSFDKKGSSLYLAGLSRVLEESSIFMFDNVVQSFEKKLLLHVWQGCSEF